MIPNNPSGFLPSVFPGSGSARRAVASAMRSSLDSPSPGLIHLNSVPATASADAAAAAFDILVRFIKTALRTLLVVGLIVAAGAFFTGPSAAAVRTRVGVFLWPGPAAPRRRIRRPVHRPRRHLDPCAPAAAAHRGGGAGRPDLRLLGPPDRGGDHRDPRPAAGGARPHRTDRQTATDNQRPHRPPPVGDTGPCS